jgi:hypothetical protein
MLNILRDPKTAQFYFKAESGKLPLELQGVFTDKVFAEKALWLYQQKVQANASKNSSQVRKAKAKEIASAPVSN